MGWENPKGKLNVESEAVGPEPAEHRKQGVYKNQKIDKPAKNGGNGGCTDGMVATKGSIKEDDGDAEAFGTCDTIHG